MKTRIAKFIADSGAASRRRAEELIAHGAVSVNGVPITTPVYFVDIGDIVAINGVPVSARQDTRLYAFHKPINTMTTTRDPMKRRTIYDVLPPMFHSLKYVGRLDYKTTGLLLMTNDGDLARRLTLPSSHVPRVYIATVAHIDAAGLQRARMGMVIGGISYRPMKIDVIAQNTLRVCVDEGKKNEVRIVLAECGCPVRKLHRISFGPVNWEICPWGKFGKFHRKQLTRC